VQLHLRIRDFASSTCEVKQRSITQLFLVDCDKGRVEPQPSKPPI